EDAYNPRYKRAASIGIVSDRKTDVKKGPMVRVTFEDTGKTSAWMPVLQHGTYGKQHSFCYRKGERVLVHRISSGLEAGVVGQSLYCNAVKAPTTPGSPHIDA